jgi:hypothetical protein
MDVQPEPVQFIVVPIKAGHDGVLVDDALKVCAGLVCGHVLHHLQAMSGLQFGCWST